jgi:hypothetical protein
LAADALTIARDFHFEDRRPVPLPSTVKRGQVVVDLPPSVGVKVLLLNEMISPTVSQGSEQSVEDAVDGCERDR